MSRNYDFEVKTGSCQYWIDFNDYENATENELNGLMNDMIATYCNNHGVDWDIAINQTEIKNCDFSDLRQFAKDIKNIDWNSLHE